MIVVNCIMNTEDVDGGGGGDGGGVWYGVGGI